MKAETDKIAHAHEIAAVEFERLASELSFFVEEQKRLTKQVSCIACIGKQFRYISSIYN